MKTAKICENCEFSRLAQIVYWGSQTVKIGPEAKKLCVIAHENGGNMRKRRVFTTSINRVPWVTDRENRPGTPKIVWYSPRKRPKYEKTTSFHDAIKSFTGHEP
jgi:hypothetical protein